MRIYLDNCCFNRPFDDQTLLRIRIETEAKLYVQELLCQRVIELAWSYVLDFENDANPFKERREAVESWRTLAVVDVDEGPEIVQLAERYVHFGLQPRDSLHIACAVVASCEAFLTTDRKLLGKHHQIGEIRLIDPPAFLREMT